MKTDHTGGPTPAADASGHTHGSPQRAAHEVAAPLLTVDLAAEVALLHAEENWQRSQHNARTLVKRPDLRVVLIALGQGRRMDAHRAPGAITIHTLDGRLRLHVGANTVDLAAGHMLALEPDATHDVEAMVESAFLLTIAWPTRLRAEETP